MTESVLIVDDEAAVLQVLGVTLGRAGFVPSLATSGEQALALLAQKEFDAAVVDKNLQGMDGIDVVRHVRRRQPLCACIVITGYPSMASAVEALRLGAMDYVEKPSPELDLIADRVQHAIAAMRLTAERDALARKLAQLQQALSVKEELIRRHAIEMAMTGELIDVRVNEAVDRFRRAARERDARLASKAGALLTRARSVKGGEALAAEIAAMIEALNAPPR